MFSNLLHNRIAVISLAGALAVGVLGGGAAFAMSGSSGSSSVSESAMILAQPSASFSPSSNTTKAPRSARAAVLRGLYAEVVKQSGLTKTQLKAGFKADQSINDLITANSGNPATVKAAVLADVATKVQAAVAADKLTTARASAITAKAPAAVDAIMSAKGGPAHKLVERLVHARRDVIKVAATTLNIAPKTLAQDIKGGQTIAQVAGTQTPAVITAIQAKADAAIDTAVTNGKIKADRAAALKTRVNTWVTNFVNNGPKHKTVAPNVVPAPNSTSTPSTNN